MSAQDDALLPIGERPRFVVIGGGACCRRWEADSIAEAVASGAGVLAGIVRTHGIAPAPGRWGRSSAMLAEAAIDAAADTPILASDGDAAAFVTGLAPDFLLLLDGGDADLAQRLAPLARSGLWSWRFGEARALSPEPAVLAAIASGKPTVAVSFVGAGRVLQVGAVGTFAARPARTIDQLGAAIATWLRRACVDVARNGFVESRFSAAEPQGAGTRVADLRVAAGMARGFVRTQALYRLSRQQWNVGLIPAPIATVAGLEGAAAQAQALAAVRWMPEEPGLFFADPFGYETAPGQIRILFELFDWSTGLGSIAMRDYVDGTFGPFRSLLDEKTHLSYPFFLTLDGAPHYIPEHAEARDLSAFALDADGQTGGRKAIWPGVELLDCTFLEHGGKVWMFALEDRPAKNTHLHLFHADTMDGPWQPHPLNPIKTDLGSARPGGTPFVHEGRLFRPSQDCSTHYGRGTVINAVLVLSESDYRETPVSRIDPPAGSPYGFGLHTLSRVTDDVTLIDGARKVGRWSR